MCLPCSLLESSISGMPFCVAKKNENSFCTIFSPSTLWTTSVSPVSSPLSVSLGAALQGRVARVTNGIGFIFLKLRHSDTPPPTPTPLSFRIEGSLALGPVGREGLTPGSSPARASLPGLVRGCPRTRHLASWRHYDSFSFHQACFLLSCWSQKQHSAADFWLRVCLPGNSVCNRKWDEREKKNISRSYLWVLFPGL